MKRNVMLALAALFLPPMAVAQTAPPETASAGRRPVIVNQAADAVVNHLKMEKRLGGGATKEMALAALDRSVDQYQGTGVSHVFWNVNYQRAAYRSDVWPSYWDDPDPEKNVTGWPRSYYELHKLGIDDVFARVIPRCRERGLSPWVSLRMNDHHYTGDPSRVSDLFRTHPEWRLNGGRGLWNYARPEVREFYLKLVGEVLLRYDTDGLELDWIRTPAVFEESDLERGRGLLTGFVRDVRQRTQAAAQRLGHPVRLAVRVPATPEFAHGKGFDAVGWAREGLVDMIIPSDWWDGYADTPVEDWRGQIGPAAKDCQIVPGTANTYACMKKGFMLGRDLAVMRGFAAQIFDRGADGMYLFNHFQPVDQRIRIRTPAGTVTNDCLLTDIFRAAGDPSGAPGRPRVHALGLHDCLPAKTDYRPAFPAKLTSNQPVALRLHTGPKPASGRCVVRVGLDQAPDVGTARIAARLNGSACQSIEDLPVPARPDPRPEQPRMNVCEVAPRVAQFDAPRDAVARGYNDIELSMREGGPQTVIWLEVAIEP